MNYNKNISCSGPSCHKIGIKIHESKEPQQVSIPEKFTTNKSSLKNAVDFYNTSLNELDLDLDNYSLEDLYKLFNIQGNKLTESVLKEAKQIVHKMHPDKSKLDPKYFLFFSKAYKTLYGIYTFQNKSEKKTYKDEDFYDDSNKNILDNMFEKNKKLKEPKDFNNWFNQQFEKHKIESEDENGYGDWLKSDEGLYSTDQFITQSNMNEAFERQKKQLQSLIVYNGVNDTFASYNSIGGSLLGGPSNNFNGGELFSDGGLGYTDLRQAHMESIIPVTQEDYEKMPKYQNVNEYKSHRDQVSVSPLSKEESTRILMKNKNHLEHESAALAFKYAQESENIRRKNESFWGDIKQLGWNK